MYLIVKLVPEGFDLLLVLVRSVNIQGWSSHKRPGSNVCRHREALLATSSDSCGTELRRHPIPKGLAGWNRQRLEAGWVALRILRLKLWVKHEGRRVGEPAVCKLHGDHVSPLPLLLRILIF